jgi:hypothetical protein
MTECTPTSLPFATPNGRHGCGFQDDFRRMAGS